MTWGCIPDLRSMAFILMYLYGVRMVQDSQIPSGARAFSGRIAAGQAPVLGRFGSGLRVAHWPAPSKSTPRRNHTSHVQSPRECRPLALSAVCPAAWGENLPSQAQGFHCPRQGSWDRSVRDSAQAVRATAIRGLGIRATASTRNLPPSPSRPSACLAEFQPSARAERRARLKLAAAGRA